MGTSLTQLQVFADNVTRNLIKILLTWLLVLNDETRYDEITVNVLFITIC